jgi:hypothetical protein
VTHLIDATAHVPACGVSTVPSSGCGEPTQGRSFCARNQEPVLHLLFAEFVHAIRVVVAGDALLGASGITLEYPVLRHASNLESVLTYEGTEEVHQLAVGKAVTDYSAFRLATTHEAPHICGNPAVAGRLQQLLCLSVVVMTGRAF